MSIGVNLRVTGYCRQGGRKYMEDFFSVAYQQTEDEKDLEYAFIGIYDGHGGAEAAAFAKEHLMESIVKHKSFWSDDDDEVLRAIRDGYLATHYAMWKEQEKWPKTASGLPSTAGTTASVAFIRRGKIYVGHVGDSGIVLGYQSPCSSEWRAKPLTRDHKPENAEEINRIQQCGGKVVLKSGVPRVVWNRPRIGHQGPVRRSTPIDEIPFLAVARSLGDLWSYNSRLNQFIVSPNPDCAVFTIDTSVHRCLIFGTDGLFNMLSSNMAVAIVHQTEKHNEYAAITEMQKNWLNPSKLLVERALEKWHFTNMRADNTSVVTLMLDPPGPPRAQVLKDRKKNLPPSGFKIITRFKESDDPNDAPVKKTPQNDQLAKDEHPITTKEGVATKEPAPSGCAEEDNNAKKTVQDNDTGGATVTCSEVSSNSSFPLKERNNLGNTKPRDSTSFDPREPYKHEESVVEEMGEEASPDDSIQINEISSSSSDNNNAEDVVEAENDHNQINRHNLRSSNSSATTLVSLGNVVKTSKTTSTSCLLKRKSREVEEEPLRKSVRLDRTRRQTSTINNAPYKENKLRRSQTAAAALSLAQRILKSKKINLKKRALKKPVIKKKLKFMVDAFKQSGASCASLVKMTAKVSAEVKTSSKTPDRCRRSRSSDRNGGGAYGKKAGSIKKRSSNEDCGRSNEVGRLRSSSSSIGDWKVTKVPSNVIINNNNNNKAVRGGDGKRMSRSFENIAKTSQFVSNKDNRKSASPQTQRKSLRQSSQSPSVKLRKRISQSK